MRTVLAAALMALGMTASGAAAQSAAPNPWDPRKVLRGMDEFAGMATGALFDDADANRDGYLSPAELRAAADARMLPFAPDARTWRTFDANGDGYLSRAEVLGGVRRAQDSARTRRLPGR